MNSLFGKSNENRHEAAKKVSPEDVEAIQTRWPIRHKAYAELYDTATNESAPVNPVTALGSYGLGEKRFDNLPPATKVVDAFQELGILTSDIER